MKRIGRHFAASYPLWISAWAVACFIHMVLPTTCSVKISFQHHAFLFSLNHHRGAGGTIVYRYEKVLFFVDDYHRSGGGNGYNRLLEGRSPCTAG